MVKADNILQSSAMKKILIVEDDRFIQNALGELLRVSGYEVFQAYDGAEGITEFRKREIDLILLDIMMPEKDGYDAGSTQTDRSSAAADECRKF